jgi:hypothetical protein
MALLFLVDERQFCPDLFHQIVTEILISGNDHFWATHILLPIFLSRIKVKSHSERRKFSISRMGHVEASFGGKLRHLKNGPVIPFGLSIY